MKECASLDEVRENIDVVDRRIVGLLSERGGYVKQAAKFKKSSEEVEAPKRVEEVVDKVRGLAGEHGVSPDVVERVYRAMISGFIEYETEERHRNQRPGK